MRQVWKEFDESVEKMFRFVSGKCVALWGYDSGGWFIEHLFRRRNKQIEYIIDIKPITRAYTPYYIRRLDPKTTAILITFAPDEKVLEYLSALGYQENVNYCCLRKLFYGENVSLLLSYCRYLENKFEVDITKPLQADHLLLPSEGHVHSPSVDYSLIDVLDNLEWTDGDSIFDFGCGKGEALLLFLRKGISIVGGIEYNNSIYQILLDNFQKLGYSTQGLMQGDAAAVTEEIDDYSYYYMYDPFEGNTFSTVIRNLENSYQRKKRNMTLIYSVPTCHEVVVKNGYFKLCKQIKTDFLDDKIVNIYRIV